MVKANSPAQQALQPPQADETDASRRRSSHHAWTRHRSDRLRSAGRAFRCPERWRGRRRIGRGYRPGRPGRRRLRPASRQRARRSQFGSVDAGQRQVRPGPGRRSGERTQAGRRAPDIAPALDRFADHRPRGACRSSTRSGPDDRDVSGQRRRRRSAAQGQDQLVRAHAAAAPGDGRRHAAFRRDAPDAGVPGARPILGGVAFDLTVRIGAFRRRTERGRGDDSRPGRARAAATASACRGPDRVALDALPLAREPDRFIATDHIPDARGPANAWAGRPRRTPCVAAAGAIRPAAPHGARQCRPPAVGRRGPGARRCRSNAGRAGRGGADLGRPEPAGRCDRQSRRDPDGSISTCSPLAGRRTSNSVHIWPERRAHLDHPGPGPGPGRCRGGPFGRDAGASPASR